MVMMLREVWVMLMLREVCEVLMLRDVCVVLMLNNRNVCGVDVKRERYGWCIWVVLVLSERCTVRVMLSKRGVGVVDVE